MVQCSLTIAYLAVFLEIAVRNLRNFNLIWSFLLKLVWFLFINPVILLKIYYNSMAANKHALNAVGDIIFTFHQRKRPCRGQGAVLQQELQTKHSNLVS